MKKRTLHIYTLLGIFVGMLFTSCSKDAVEDNADKHDVKFGVGFADVWKEGIFNSNTANQQQYSQGCDTWRVDKVRPSYDSCSV